MTGRESLLIAVCLGVLIVALLIVGFTRGGEDNAPTRDIDVPWCPSPKRPTGVVVPPPSTLHGVPRATADGGATRPTSRPCEEPGQDATPSDRGGGRGTGTPTAPDGRDGDDGGAATGAPRGEGVEAGGRGRDTPTATIVRGTRGDDRSVDGRDVSRQVPVVQEAPSTLWLRGYRDHGGRAEWEAHFIETVIPCEGAEFDWDWRYDTSLYVSILQFDAQMWAIIANLTGHSNPEDLYHVGANAAYWSNAVDPASEAGWADCWKGR